MTGRSPSGRATHERSQSPLSPPTVSVPNAAELSASSMMRHQRDKLCKLREAMEYYRDSDQGPPDLEERYWAERDALSAMELKAIRYADAMGRPPVLGFGPSPLERAKAKHRPLEAVDERVGITERVPVALAPIEAQSDATPKSDAARRAKAGIAPKDRA